MATILGLDPGSRITGYGFILLKTQGYAYLASGCVRVKGEDLPQRLQHIFLSIHGLIQQHQPQHAAIEQVFFHRNADSALKLGQARGAAIVAMAGYNIPTAEYTARQVKQSVVGYGAAKKEQVQHMVCTLLNLSDTPQEDAADALAVAICHGHHLQTSKQLLRYQQLVGARKE